MNEFNENENNGFRWFFIYILLLGIIRFIPHLFNIDETIFKDIYDFIIDLFDFILIILVSIQIMDNRKIIKINNEQLDLIKYEKISLYKAKLHISETDFAKEGILRIYNAGLSSAFDLNIKTIDNETKQNINVYRYKQGSYYNMNVIKDEVILPSGYLDVYIQDAHKLADIYISVQYKDNSIEKIHNIEKTIVSMHLKILNDLIKENK